MMAIVLSSRLNVQVAPGGSVLTVTVCELPFTMVAQPERNIKLMTTTNKVTIELGTFGFMISPLLNIKNYMKEV